MAKKIVGSFKTKVRVPRPTVKLEDKKANQKAQRAVNQGMIKSSSYIKTTLSKAVESSLKSSSWGWPHETKRKNGSTAGVMRDIVDTGELLKKHYYHEVFLQTQTKIEVEVRSPYAMIVHNGGVIQPYGDPNLPAFVYPARPWVKAAMLGTHGRPKPDFQADISRAFAEAWKKAFPGGTVS